MALSMAFAAVPATLPMVPVVRRQSWVDDGGGGKQRRWLGFDGRALATTR